ncbi:MAG: amino acid ABC transporter permease [Desulfovibrio sp.]|jgi:polar amino acid transport system permease protein|nr:amino acid ABC transporter permease [Desulfovibrio sp.]
MSASLILIQGALPSLLAGAVITIGTVLCAMLLGLVLGVPLSVLQIYGPAPARFAVGIYVWFFRGVPILVLLYLFYFGICFSLGLDISAFAASCLVLGLTSAAYQSQIFRGAINSLPAGQLKAARALGMDDLTAIVSILLPQALRLSIPGWSNEYSILLKDSVLVSVLGTMELMFRTKAMATTTEEFTAFYVTAAILYFLITLLGVRLLRLLEKTLRIPGYTHL